MVKGVEDATQGLDVNKLMATIRRMVGNRAVRFIIRRMGNPLRLIKILGIYAGVEDSSNIREKSWAKLISKLLEEAGSRFGFDSNEIRSRLRDPYIRRGVANILLGISKYGITRPQRLYAPFMIVWDFTKQCNLRCKHCYANATPLPAKDELTLSERMEVLRQLDEAGVAAISFSGGEPLMNRDFWPVAEKAAEIGMYISVATNGTLITEGVAKKLKEIGVRYVEVSIDSPYPDAHDEFRGIPGAWEKAVRGIKNAKKVGLDVGIATTVTKINYGDMPDMIKLARELKVDRFIAFNFIPTGRGKEIIELDLSPDERMELLEYFYQEWMSGELQIFSTAPMYAIVSLSHIDEGGKISPTHFAELAIPEEYMSAGFALGEFLGGCGAGRIYCSIEHNGDIYPCVFLPIKVGNVIKDGFLKIWHESPILKMLRDRDHYACSSCPYRYICGGCRARAYAYFNDIRGPDPSCSFNEKYWNEIILDMKH